MNAVGVEALRIDGDDLSFDLLPEIERSFGLRLEQADIEHVRTVGDLHALILSKAPGVSGSVCGTMLVFHLLRRALLAHGVDVRAGPHLMLNSQTLPPPKQLRAEMPAGVAGGWCSFALGLLIVLPLASWAFGQPWLAFAAPPLCWAIARFDKGSWSGDWATLGSLSRATAALNHAALAQRGARHSPAAAWNTLRNLLAGYGRGTRDVRPSTRLMG